MDLPENGNRKRKHDEIRQDVHHGCDGSVPYDSLTARRSRARCNMTIISEFYRLIMMCYSQITPSKVIYGQVNQSTVTDTARAITVDAIAHHHHMYNFLQRIIRRRKKNRKANLTGNMTHHQSIEAAFSIFKILGIVSRRSSNALKPAL